MKYKYPTNSWPIDDIFKESRLLILEIIPFAIEFVDGEPLHDDYKDAIIV